MKKRFIMAAAITVAAVIGGLYGYMSQSAFGNSDTFLSNVEALAEEESSNPIWNIDKYDCIISAELAAKLGITIHGGGLLSISGARDCSSGGTSMCTPISCVQLYEALK